MGGGGRGAGPRRGGQRTAAAAPPQRGQNIRHELDLPMSLAVHGGETQFYLDGEKLSVTIPPGVNTGAKMRLRERGQPSPNGGPRGDLILLIKVSDHPYYRRVGNNLEVKLPVTVAEAVLGAKVDVPTPNGTVTMTIPPGTSSGKRLRLKGQGVKSRDGNAGDLIVEVQIHLPKEISDESKQLIEQFDAQNQLSPRDGISF